MGRIYVCDTCWKYYCLNNFKLNWLRMLKVECWTVVTYGSIVVTCTIVSVVIMIISADTLTSANHPSQIRVMHHYVCCDSDRSLLFSSSNVITSICDSVCSCEFMNLGPTTIQNDVFSLLLSSTYSSAPTWSSRPARDSSPHPKSSSSKIYNYTRRGRYFHRPTFGIHREPSGRLTWRVWPSLSRLRSSWRIRRRGRRSWKNVWNRIKPGYRLLHGTNSHLLPR